MSAARPTYNIPKQAAERLADIFDAMSPDDKSSYPEMQSLVSWLRQEATIYGRALIQIADEDCIPYPGAPDMCSFGTVFTDTAGRRIISDGFASRQSS